jgi:hypothetical protein
MADMIKLQQVPGYKHVDGVKGVRVLEAHVTGEYDNWFEVYYTFGGHGTTGMTKCATREEAFREYNAIKKDMSA